MSLAARARRPACSIDCGALTEATRALRLRRCSSGVSVSTSWATFAAPSRLSTTLWRWAQAERSPSARIHLLLLPPGAPEPTSVEVQIDDGLTGKQVSRRIELSRVPADSRPLVVAVGADELLSASWAELNVKHVAAPRPARPAPRVVAPPPARRRIDIALLGTAEANGAARWRFGGALANSWWPTSAFAISLRLGFARGVAVSAPDGAVHSDSFTLVGGLLLPLVQRSYGGVEAGPALLLARTLVRGEPNAGSTGYHGAFSSVGAEAELRAWWAPWSGPHLPRWTLTSYLGVGGWFRSVDVLDGQHRLKLQRSPLASAGLGVAVQIP